MIRFAARNKPKAVVDMIPMIDIVFQLVIFFMVATTFKTTTGMELNIPNAKKVSNVPTSTLQVYIRSNSDIRVGDTPTGLAHFEQNLPAVGNDKKSVIIYGNKDVEYQLLIDIMDILRQNNYESIDLAIKKR